MAIRKKLLQMLFTEVLYKEELVKLIDSSGRMYTAKSVNDVIAVPKHTLKIEGMERVFRSVFEMGQELSKEHNHNGPVTCHLFWAKVGSPSFPTHTDPYDVFLKVIEGKKIMEVANVEHEITKTSPLFKIEGKTPHRAINRYESWMLSFGLDDFIEERGKCENGICKTNRHL